MTETRQALTPEALSETDNAMTNPVVVDADPFTDIKAPLRGGSKKADERSDGPAEGRNGAGPKSALRRLRA